MNNLIRVNAQSRTIQPTNNGCYAPQPQVWQDENRQLEQWNSNRNSQLAQLFGAVNLQPERRQPETDMENLVQTIAGMFGQCGISVEFYQIEYQPADIAFVFNTYENMLANRAVIACQHIGEVLTKQIGKRVISGTQKAGPGYHVTVWVGK